jgi:hypothetical protein
MAERTSMSFTRINVENRTDHTKTYAAIFHGDSDTRAEILAEVPTDCAKGSIYLSSGGEMFMKVNTASAATDWQKVTTTAAD